MNRLRIPAAWTILGLLSLAPTASAQRAVISRLDGEVVKLARLVSIEEDRLQGIDDDGETRELDLSSLVAVEFGRTRVPSNADVRLRFFNGDNIGGVIIGGDDQVVELEHRDLGPIRFDIETVAELQVLGNLGEIRRIFRPRDGEDTLYLFREGGQSDVLTGTLESFGRDGIEFDSPLGIKTYRYSELVALALPPLGEPDKAEGLRAQLALRTGGRLTGRLQGINQSKLAVALDQGVEIAVPVAAVLEVSLRSDRFAHLSDLEPTEVVEQPAFGDSQTFLFPFQRDSSVTGGPLRLGGRVYLKGLGVHSRCRLTYDLGGQYASFRSLIGIDDSVLDLEARGSVVFRVLADGQKVFESDVVQGGSPPVAIPAIDLSDVRRLQLEVDFATEFDIADRANWVRPILLRK